MRTEQKTKLRLALHELTTKRHGHSIDDRLGALENVIALLAEILLVDAEKRDQRDRRE
jgi:hypothetical protein